MHFVQIQHIITKPMRKSNKLFHKFQLLFHVRNFLLTFSVDFTYMFLFLFLQIPDVISKPK